MIRARIDEMEDSKAKNIALLALSRIILAVSFQDSETRYSSRPRDIPQGMTLKRFLLALDEIVRSVIRTQPALRYGVSSFLTGDTRELTEDLCKPDSVDLIVTSPPYGNANDYHLYHRFRLLWLGHNPGDLARVEIGSHLRHQRESSGFDSYLKEMTCSLKGMQRVLKPGRYAVIVVGDSLYEKVFLYDCANSVSEAADKIGFETVCIIERPIHSTRRSFNIAGRRASSENLLVLRKPPKHVIARLQPPPYRLWGYEAVLRGREIQTILGKHVGSAGGEEVSLRLDPYEVTKIRRLVFTHGVGRIAMKASRPGRQSWKMGSGINRRPARIRSMQHMDFILIRANCPTASQGID